MLKVSLATFALLLGASSARAQSCSVLVDDFTAIRTGSLPGETVVRDFNLLGGDYGKSDGASLTYTIDTTAKHVELTAGATENFWFAKFDRDSCFDLVTPKYQAIVFDLVAPAGSDFTMTLTQKTPDCVDRAGANSDSVYVPLTKYITPNGQKQTVTVPFSDFATNLAGQPFDMVHLKDWTIVGVKPVGTKMQLSNLLLTRACNGTLPSSTASTVSATGTATSSLPSTATGTATGSVPVSTGIPSSSAGASSSSTKTATATETPKTPGSNVTSGASGLGANGVLIAAAALGVAVAL
ncbi:uncharacterized protein SPPG_02609 [Spizellomyces punctatus DAOM BR117]|uniref:Uncharacterized protein n=1 Tax=Spizellomyces punctatus (strain DAOM BR117) TaxID=645134 RepID=A0A0L0HM34_SPIPD|nr:uncharacterized protein SPPG_02609 [Spizellomyces punctatus DAOM BR117]KND02113.1 hypothetical protein SPPG_02609 [Spizellomyces punctatus DAOM BR117]|eukprot:XP_016610152.1 hypothetical protein SPPG_02609 [Spizellomyces punctatus DAOM BR117]